MALPIVTNVSSCAAAVSLGHIRNARPSNAHLFGGNYSKECAHAAYGQARTARAPGHLRVGRVRGITNKSTA